MFSTTISICTFHGNQIGTPHDSIWTSTNSTLRFIFALPALEVQILIELGTNLGSVLAN